MTGSALSFSGLPPPACFETSLIAQCCWLAAGRGAYYSPPLALPPSPESVRTGGGPAVVHTGGGGPAEACFEALVIAQCCGLAAGRGAYCPPPLALSPSPASVCTGGPAVVCTGGPASVCARGDGLAVVCMRGDGRRRSAAPGRGGQGALGGHIWQIFHAAESWAITYHRGRFCSFFRLSCWQPVKTEESAADKRACRI